MTVPFGSSLDLAARYAAELRRRYRDPLRGIVGRGGPPPDGVYVDASRPLGRRCWQIGAVAVVDGEVVRDRVSRVAVANSENAETEAVLAGVNLAVGLGLGTVYSDSPSAVKRADGTWSPRDLATARCRLTQRVRIAVVAAGVAVRYVERGRNGLAHVAARLVPPRLQRKTERQNADYRREQAEDDHRVDVAWGRPGS